MALLATVFIGITALLHVYIFIMESIQWRQPAIWKRFGVASQADADTMAVMAYNQGFYNLFLAIGAALGLILYWTSAHQAGLALAAFTSASIVFAAIVLLTSGKRRLRPALIQGLPALLGLVFLVLAG